MKHLFTLTLMALFGLQSWAQAQNQDSLALEKLRAQSGVDPTRIQTRVGYSFLFNDAAGNSGSVKNRLTVNLGVGRWSFQVRNEVVSVLPQSETATFTSSFGDPRFSVLNAFFVKGRHALAAAGELNMPIAKAGFGTQYLSITPSLTYAYTISPTLIFATQPQYTFALARAAFLPDLHVITVRTFLAKFTRAGYFFVFEPRPVFDLENDKVDFILSPIIGRSIGAGFNLVFLSEISVKEETRSSQGVVYLFGFNKNF
ncbi:MAG: hypothetical protein LW884_11275 [Bacteroidetes bacterium]|jgi:hypothetical protein|nr:hypothetical protein [Bacteroidota bacterium]